MRQSALFAVFLGLIPGSGQAAACAETFAKSGSPIGGLTFTAAATLDDLPPASAIGQMRGIALAKGYDILVEEPEEGSMLIEQPMTGSARAFPITVSATRAGSVGTIRMEAKLRAGMFVKEEAARTEICAMLDQVKGGRAGLAAAAAARTAVSAGAAPVVLSALAFSHQISKDTERNPAAVPLRYRGKQFTIWGMVDHVARDGEFYRVAFKVPNPWEEAIRLPNTAPFKTDVSCLMARGQAALALTLKPDKQIRFTGTWHEFDQFRHVVWLRDCRPATR